MAPRRPQPRARSMDASESSMWSSSRTFGARRQQRTIRAPRRQQSMDDMSEISNMSRSNNFRRVHKTASGISGIMKAVLGATQTGAAMFDEEELETELNIFCSDVIVSTKFTMSRLKHARKTPSIVRLELEDLLEREDTNMFSEIQAMLTADHREWDYIRFVDHIYSEERFQRYLDRKQELWELVEEDAMERLVSLAFNPNYEFQQGSSVESVISLLQKVSESSDLQSIEFAGAMFGCLLWDIPKKLHDLCQDGCLQEAVVLRPLYLTASTAETASTSDALSLSKAIASMGDESCRRKLGDEKLDDAPSTIKARSVRVLAACITRLQGIVSETARVAKETGDEDSRCCSFDDDSDTRRKRGRGLSAGALPEREIKKSSSQRWKLAKPSVKAITNKTKLTLVRKGLKMGRRQAIFGGSSSNLLRDSNSSLFGNSSRSSRPKPPQRSKSEGTAGKRTSTRTSTKTPSTQGIRPNRNNSNIEKGPLIRCNTSGDSYRSPRNIKRNSSSGKSPAHKPIQTQQDLSNLLNALMSPNAGQNSPKGEGKTKRGPMDDNPLTEEFLAGFLAQKKLAHSKDNTDVAPPTESEDDVPDSGSKGDNMNTSLSLLDLLGDDIDEDSSSSNDTSCSTAHSEFDGEERNVIPSDKGKLKSSEQLHENTGDKVADGEVTGVGMSMKMARKKKQQATDDDVRYEESLAVVEDANNNTAEVCRADDLPTKKAKKKKTKGEKQASRSLDLSAEEKFGHGYAEEPLGESEFRPLEEKKRKKKKKKSDEELLSYGDLESDAALSVDLSAGKDEEYNTGAEEVLEEQEPKPKTKRKNKKKVRGLESDTTLSVDLSTDEGAIEGYSEEQSTKPKVKRKKKKKDNELESDGALSVDLSLEEDIRQDVMEGALGGLEPKTKMKSKKKKKKKKDRDLESDAALSVDLSVDEEVGHGTFEGPKKEKRRKKKKGRERSSIGDDESEGFLSVDGDDDFAIEIVEASIEEIESHELGSKPSKKERRRRKKQLKETTGDTESIGSLSVDFLDTEFDSVPDVYLEEPNKKVKKKKKKVKKQLEDLDNLDSLPESDDPMEDTNDDELDDKLRRKKRRRAKKAKKSKANSLSALDLTSMMTDTLATAPEAPNGKPNFQAASHERRQRNQGSDKLLQQPMTGPLAPWRFCTSMSELDFYQDYLNSDDRDTSEEDDDDDISS